MKRARYYFVMYIAIQLILILQNLHATNSSQKIIALKQELTASPVDSTRANILNDISWEYFETDYDSAKKYADLALAVSRKCKHLKGEAYALSEIGRYYKFTGNYDLAVQNYVASLEVRKAMDNPKLIGMCYISLGTLHREQVQFQKALEYYLKAKPHLENDPDREQYAKLLNSIGTTYKHLAKYPKALEYLEEALDIRQKIGNEKYIVQSQLSLGTLHEATGNYIQARELYDLCHQYFLNVGDKRNEAKVKTNLATLDQYEGKFNGALEKYKHAADIQKNLGDMPALAGINSNMGSIYLELGFYDQALKFFSASLEISQLLKDDRGLMTAYHNTGKVYQRTGAYEDAITQYLNSLDIAEKDSANLAQLDILQSLSTTYESMGEYQQAHYYQKKLTNIQEAHHRNFKSYKLLEDQYEKQRQELKIEEEHSLRNLILFIAALIMLIIVVISFMLFVRSYHIQQKAKQEVAVKEAQITQLKEEQENKVLNAIFEGQEKLRKKIAEDLHDRLGGTIALVKIQFKNFNNSLDEIRDRAKEDYQKAVELLDDAAEEVRSISQELISSVLMDFGLVAAVESFCQKMENVSGVPIYIHTFGMDKRLKNPVEIELYRVVQEAVTNIIKYAKANEVNIQLNHLENNTFNLVIEDDGIGFDPKDSNFKPGMGLRNMESRIKNLHGEFHIDTGKGGGTTIIANIPV